MRELAKASTTRSRSLVETVFDSLELAAYAVLPLVSLPLILAIAWRQGKFAVDFHHYVWPAARNLVHGLSPFPTIIDNAHVTASFIYPAPAALLLAPMGLLPHTLADVVFTGIVILAIPLTLHLAGVEDGRCYGAALIWPPVLLAIQTANLTLLLGLGLAVLWRVRRHALAAAAVVAVLVALKIFLWPLIAWLIVRHGIRLALLAVGFVPLITLGAWAVIGLAGLRDYPRMLSIIEHSFGPTSYSGLALAMRFGLDESFARVVPFVCATLMLGGAWMFRRLRNELVFFVIAVFAAILSSPVVWLHYYALLLLPLAILRPRFGLVWLVPALLWFCPVGLSGPSWYPLAPLLLFAAVLASANVSLAVQPKRAPKAVRLA